MAAVGVEVSLLNGKLFTQTDIFLSKIKLSLTVIGRYEKFFNHCIRGSRKVPKGCVPNFGKVEKQKLAIMKFSQLL